MMGWGFWLMFLVLVVPVALVVSLLLLIIRPIFGQGNPPMARAERAALPSDWRACSHCGAGLQAAWAHCPQCGAPTGPNSGSGK